MSNLKIPGEAGWLIAREVDNADQWLTMDGTFSDREADAVALWAFGDAYECLVKYSEDKANFNVRMVAKKGRWS